MPNFLTLRASLKHAKPSIWRKIEVDDSITFDELHLVMQAIMGWDNYHLYRFNIGRDVVIDCDLKQRLEYGPFLGESKKLFDAGNVILSEFIKKENDKFLYTYDFGDNWKIELTIKSITPQSRKSKNALCLSGKRNAPPEDSGGVWGYYHYLEVLQNKNHPEYRERSEWIGKNFDSEHFDLKQINKQLEILNK